ncbi:hypothetical protein HYX19_03670 [Candidatus Woesearchaeota archaeon]|nr:hypothetical protein [Candidatus Woesearchaeota archaeon]
MVYTEFSTERANYVLQLGDHLYDNRHDINMFEGIDALVLESGQCIPKYELGFIVNDKQCRSTTSHYKDNCPIFFTDCPTTVTGKLRSIALLPMIPILYYYSFSTKKLDKIIGRLLTDSFFVLQDPIVECRNAINARKIEEFVVPRITKPNSNKPPKIGLIFGTGHIGLEYSLKSKKRRDFTLWNWRNLNFRRYCGLNIAELNKVYEARANRNQWEIKEYNTGLFG